jgi:hypothetical protein
MTDQEILIKAIEKAQINGWSHIGWGLIIGEEASNNAFKWNDDDWLQYLSDKQYYTLIFDKDFAKALWGDEEWFLSDLGEWHKSVDHPDWLGADSKLAWEYHLQTMVISDNPIKYLGENI